jgi:hypothetical protein
MVRREILPDGISKNQIPIKKFNADDSAPPGFTP